MTWTIIQWLSELYYTLVAYCFIISPPLLKAPWCRLVYHLKILKFIFARSFSSKILCHIKNLAYSFPGYFYKVISLFRLLIQRCLKRDINKIYNIVFSLHTYCINSILSGTLSKRRHEGVIKGQTTCHPRYRVSDTLYLCRVPFALDFLHLGD